MPDQVSSSRYPNGRYANEHPDWHQADSLWKAQQIHMIRKNKLSCRTITDVGCGAG
jgi:ubiquinone/menaquinone biosynthesis C-methylase UbiE